MKNIHVLPTGKPSKIFYSNNNSELLFSKEPILFRTFERSTQNIYITSNEEIKEGDWFYSPFQNEERILKYNKFVIPFPKDKKIILTTDQDLIKDGVQAIDNEFLEWFVKNPSCEEVEVSYEVLNPFQSIDKGYVLRLPDITNVLEEPKQENCCTPIGQIKRYLNCKGCDRKPKQETTPEEAAENKYTQGVCIVNNIDLYQVCRDCFIAGAEWQSKQPIN